MIKGATVTLPLEAFESIRQDCNEYQRLAKRISSCFEYKTTTRPNAKECEVCTSGICYPCPILKEAPPVGLKELFVDIDALLVVAQEYALYGKTFLEEDSVIEPDHLPLKTSWDYLREKEDT